MTYKHGQGLGLTYINKKNITDPDRFTVVRVYNGVEIVVWTSSLGIPYAPEQGLDSNWVNKFGDQWVLDVISKKKLCFQQELDTLLKETK